MRLTNATNEPMYVNPMQVISIYKDVDNDDKAIITTNDGDILVQEDYETVVRMHERFIKRIGQ
jgi:hypothetical protein